MRQIHILAAISLCFTLVELAHADCTQEQAFNKMMVLNQAKSEVQAKMNSLPAGPAKNSVMARWARLGQEIAMVGKDLASKNYNVACTKYDQIAQRHKINVEEVAKRSKTVAQLKK